jgi:hypothetical protein
MATYSAASLRKKINLTEIHHQVFQEAGPLLSIVFRLVMMKVGIAGKPTFAIRSAQHAHSL